MKFHFSDLPIDGSEQSPDRLDRSAFVAYLAASLDGLSTEASSTVSALIGPWGSGKTSVIELLRARLRLTPEGTPALQVVDFTPWFYQDLASLQIGFFATLHSAIDSPRTRRAKAIRKSLGSFAEQIAPLSSAGSLLGWDPSRSLDGVARLMQSKTSPDAARRRLKGLLTKSPQRLLIIIDDLDRLDAEELLLTFKLLRLTGRLPYIHYLLAYDERTLLETLSGAQSNHSTTPSRDTEYLEKIVQLRFDLPPLRSTQSSELIDSAIDDLGRDIGLLVTPGETSRFSRAYEYHLKRRLSTPRAISRFIAQVSSSYANLQGEVDSVDFLLLTWLRTAEPRLYAELSQQKSDLTGSGSFSSQLLLSRTKPQDLVSKWRGILNDSGTSPTNLDGVAEVVGLIFPRFRSIWNSASSFADTTEWHTPGQRACDENYFDRFFAFEVTREDVPDSDVRDALLSIASGSEMAPAEKLKNLLTKNTRLAISRIEAALNDLPASQNAAVVSWLTDQFRSIPSSNELLNPRDRATGLMMRMLAHINTSQKREIFMRLMDDSELIQLAGTLLDNLAQDDGDDEFTSDIKEKLLTAAEARLLSLNTKSPFELADADWHLVWVVRNFSAIRAHSLIDAKIAQGWSRREVAARLVRTSIPVGVVNPVYRIDEVNLDLIGEFVDIEALTLEVGPTALGQVQNQSPHRPEATPQARDEALVVALAARSRQKPV